MVFHLAIEILLINSQNNKIFTKAQIYPRGICMYIHIMSAVGGGRGYPISRCSKGGCVNLVLWIGPKCRQGGGSKISKILQTLYVHASQPKIPLPPQVTCKVLDLRSKVWSDGPSLPGNPSASSGSGSAFGLKPGFTRGTAYHKDGKVNAPSIANDQTLVKLGRFLVVVELIHRPTWADISCTTMKKKCLTWVIFHCLLKIIARTRFCDIPSATYPRLLSARQ